MADTIKSEMRENQIKSTEAAAAAAAATATASASARGENLNKKIDELEKNINISLKNIKENSEKASGKSENNENEDKWDKQGNKYGFYKEYKLDVSERWTDTNSNGFNTWKVKAVRYLESAKSTYAESIKTMMAYVQNKENPIDLKGKMVNWYIRKSSKRSQLRKKWTLYYSMNL